MSSTSVKSRSIDPQVAFANAMTFIKDVDCDENRLRSLSPSSIPNKPDLQHAVLMKALFAQTEHIRLREAVEVKGRMVPCGNATITQVQQFVDFALEGFWGTCLGDLGTYFNINPVKEGHKPRQEVRDADLAQYRYALVEHDELSVDEQSRLLVRLPIPIVAIINTGGKSLHAIVRINAHNLWEYKDLVARLYKAISRFGFDRSNKNPGRYSRVPGLLRRLEDGSHRMPQLVYLNPDATSNSILP